MMFCVNSMNVGIGTQRQVAKGLHRDFHQVLLVEEIVGCQGSGW